VRADLASSGRDQLPDAAVVAARHGVSDHVARRALDLLGSEGLERDVRRKPKRVGPDAAELALTAACAVRISSVDLDERRETVWLRRAIRREPGAGWAEADLKTHQQRRIALDAEPSLCCVNRTFKAHYGSSPTDYRHAARDDTQGGASIQRPVAAVQRPAAGGQETGGTAAHG
jgi:hypothetical protein